MLYRFQVPSSEINPAKDRSLLLRTVFGFLFRELKRGLFSCLYCSPRVFSRVRDEGLGKEFDFHILLISDALVTQQCHNLSHK